jgi:hypothetical protein
LRSANDCPNRDPWKFEVYGKPFPEQHCPATMIGDFEIEPGFWLISQVDNCDWQSHRWTEKKWNLNKFSDVYTEFKFVFYKTKLNGATCHNNGI